MTSFENRVQDSLTRDDEAFLQDLEGDRGLFTQMGATFTGPLKYWTAMVFVFIFGFMALGVYFAFQLYAATDLKASMLWAFGITGCVFAISMFKMWLFMRMNHLQTLREIKRLELQVARLKEN